MKQVQNAEYSTSKVDIDRVISYLSERIEERLETAGTPDCLDFVDVDGTAARQRSIRTDVGVQHVIAAAISSWSQILRAHSGFLKRLIISHTSKELR